MIGILCDREEPKTDFLLSHEVIKWMLNIWPGTRTQIKISDRPWVMLTGMRIADDGFVY